MKHWCLILPSQLMQIPAGFIVHPSEMLFPQFQDYTVVKVLSLHSEQLHNINRWQGSFKTCRLIMKFPLHAPLQARIQEEILKLCVFWISPLKKKLPPTFHPPLCCIWATNRGPESCYRWYHRYQTNQTWLDKMRFRWKNNWTYHVKI